MKKEKTIADQLTTVPNIKVPLSTMRVFGSKEVSIHGDQIAFSSDCDYVTLQEARTAVEWLVEQLNGKVKWE